MPRVGSRARRIARRNSVSMIVENPVLAQVRFACCCCCGARVCVVCMGGMFDFLLLVVRPPGLLLRVENRRRECVLACSPVHTRHTRARASCTQTGGGDSLLMGQAYPPFHALPSMHNVSEGGVRVLRVGRA